jgi:hypothetical protein
MTAIIAANAGWKAKNVDFFFRRACKIDGRKAQKSPKLRASHCCRNVDKEARKPLMHFSG